MFKFLLTNGIKWTDPKEFDLKKYNNISSKGYVLKVDLDYSGELHKLHNDYCLVRDKIEIKREMSNYQIKFADF